MCKFIHVQEHNRMSGDDTPSNFGMTSLQQFLPFLEWTLWTAIKDLRGKLCIFAIKYMIRTLHFSG